MLLIVQRPKNIIAHFGDIKERKNMPQSKSHLRFGYLTSTLVVSQFRRCIIYSFFTRRLSSLSSFFCCAENISRTANISVFLKKRKHFTLRLTIPQFTYLKLKSSGLALAFTTKMHRKSLSYKCVGTKYNY